MTFDDMGASLPTTVVAAAPTGTTDHARRVRRKHSSSSSSSILNAGSPSMAAHDAPPLTRLPSVSVQQQLRPERLPLNTEPAVFMEYGFIPGAATVTQRYLGDSLVFAEANALPGVPIVMRLPEERAANPDRLNLEARALRYCPLIERDEHLRMLSLQRNHIRVIEVAVIGETVHTQGCCQPCGGRETAWR